MTTPASIEECRSVADCDAYRDTLATEAQGLIDRSENLAGDDLARFEAIESDLATLRQRREQWARIERAVEHRHYDEPGPAGPFAIDGSRQAPQHMRRVDPNDRHAAIEDRAAAAVERQPFASDAAKEAGVRLLERSATDEHLTGVAEHLLMASDVDYAKAFRKAWDRPADFGNLLTPEEQRAWSRVNQWHSRAAMSLTSGNGGYLVPQFLDPTINLTNAGTQSDVRRFARNEQITVDQWDGVNSAGVDAEWLAEGTEAADATPTLTQPTITTHKGSAWVYGSYEVLADSGFDEIGMLLADAKDRLEATSLITGTGSGQPYGLITRLSGTGPVVLGTSGDEGAADFVRGDLYALDNALGSRWRRNARWLSSKPFQNEVRQVWETVENAPWVEPSGGNPGSLLGYQYGLADDMDDTIVSGSNDYVLILGDFRQYVVVNRIGMTVLYEPLVKGANQRPTGQAGWFGYFRTGADVLTSNAFKVLKL